ncbi:uncharacterized protein [Rutidosis leptorrhynchoides]|uniref:uncharacterized protein n=1 Tax=Rutidosis leptorrhynchoides TaxID=125765 RepID=UPI003A9A3A1E
MAFQSKAEFMFPIRKWNIKNSREIIVTDTRPDYAQIKCFTRGKKYKGPQEAFPCMWSVTGSSKNKYRIWRISKWVNSHNCYGYVRGNNNRCLTSSLIATDIACQVNANMAYPVKHIQAHIKDTWNVDVSYTKAWNARRIAIERIFGTWESNFAELPSYKGKLLTAVTKNANGHILPVAFAMVDKESNENWSWFLHLFRIHVASRNPRELCVILDRHQGILNAVSQIPGWHHRYCLRHIRSNFNSRFNDHQLKRLCWTVGSTTQSTIYRWVIGKIKGIKTEAWQYLKDIDPKMWSLFRDKDHRRWGNLTTNIAESLNNVLRYARLMPIKACIEYTFDYTRKHFIKQYDYVREWNAPLARLYWKLYQFRETRAASHTVTVYNVEEGVYNVHTIGERIGDGGNEFIVQINAGKCSFGRWQNQRIPCSHVIAACGH